MHTDNVFEGNYNLGNTLKTLNHITELFCLQPGMINGFTSISGFLYTFLNLIPVFGCEFYNNVIWQRNTYFTTIRITLIISLSHKSMFINLFFIVIIIVIMGQAYSVNFNIFITINILLYQCWQRVVCIQDK